MLSRRALSSIVLVTACGSVDSVGASESDGGSDSDSSAQPDTSTETNLEAGTETGDPDEAIPACEPIPVTPQDCTYASNWPLAYEPISQIRALDGQIWASIGEIVIRSEEPTAWRRIPQPFSGSTPKNAPVRIWPSSANKFWSMEGAVIQERAVSQQFATEWYIVGDLLSSIDVLDIDGVAGQHVFALVRGCCADCDPCEVEYVVWRTLQQMGWWADTELPPSGSRRLLADALGVWLIGAEGQVARFEVEAQTWQSVAIDVDGDWTAIAGTETNLWLGGAQGELAHYDGQTWTAVPSADAEPVLAIAVDEQETWLLSGSVDAGQSLHRWAEGSWTEQASVEGVRDLIIVDAQWLAISGGAKGREQFIDRIARADASVREPLWRRYDLGDLRDTAALGSITDVIYLDAKHIVRVHQSLSFDEYDHRSELLPVAAGDPADLWAAWAAGEDDVWAVGHAEGGTAMWRWQGQGFEPIAFEHPPALALHDITGHAGLPTWAVGRELLGGDAGPETSEGTPAAYRFVDGTWVEASAGLVGDEALIQVHSSAELTVARSPERLFRWTGESWVELAAPPGQPRTHVVLGDALWARFTETEPDDEGNTQRLLAWRDGQWCDLAGLDFCGPQNSGCGVWGDVGAEIDQLIPAADQAGVWLGVDDWTGWVGYSDGAGLTSFGTPKYSGNPGDPATGILAGASEGVLADSPDGYVWNCIVHGQGG